MIIQLLLETAGVFIYHNEQDKNLFNSAFRNLTFFEPQNPTEVAVLKWLELKELYFSEKNNLKFIVESLDFLRTEPVELDILKLSLIDNVISVLPFTETNNEAIYRKIAAFCKTLNVSEKHKQFCLNLMEPITESRK